MVSTFSLVIFCHICIIVFADSCSSNNVFNSYPRRKLSGFTYKRFENIGIQMCMNECIDSPMCLSFNYNMIYLYCDLNTEKVNHTLILEEDLDYTYVQVTDNLNKICGSVFCDEYDTCVTTRQNDKVCVLTDCANQSPELTNGHIKKRTYSPNSLMYQCDTGYTTIGDGNVIHCLPGGRWTSLSMLCKAPIHGGWSSWGSWNSCSVTCNGGTKYRSRSCTNPSPLYGGSSCSGTSSTSTSCNTNPCPVHGGWSSWGSWGSCSVTCNGGTKYRSRSCTNPSPLYGGNSCSGTSSTSTSCNTNPCPVNGAWGGWSSWGSCSKDCGGGTKTRYRSCNNPTPQYGGLSCSGSSSSSTSCNTDCCKVLWVICTG